MVSVINNPLTKAQVETLQHISGPINVALEKNLSNLFIDNQESWLRNQSQRISVLRGHEMMNELATIVSDVKSLISYDEKLVGGLKEALVNFKQNPNDDNLVKSLNNNPVVKELIKRLEDTLVPKQTSLF